MENKIQVISDQNQGEKMLNIKLEVDNFYKELESVEFYNYKLRMVNLKLEEIAVKLYEAEAIDYTKENLGGSNAPKYSPKLGLMLKEEKLIEHALIWERKINRCRRILYQCSEDVKTALIQKYVLKNSWEAVADQLNISRPPLVRKIDSELKSVLQAGFEKGTIVP